MARYFPFLLLILGLTAEGLSAAEPDCPERVFSALAPQSRIPRLDLPVRSANPEPPEFKPPALTGLVEPEHVATLERFLEPSGIPLFPGPKFYRENVKESFTAWKQDLDAYFEKLASDPALAPAFRDQMEAIYLDYVRNPPEQTPGNRYLPGLEEGAPNAGQNLRQHFGSPDRVLNHGIVVRTLRNQWQGFADLLADAPPKSEERRHRMISIARIGYLLTKIHETAERLGTE